MGKGVDDNHSLDEEIGYQDKMLFLGQFHLDLYNFNKSKKADKAMVYLTEVALYINRLEQENMVMKLETRFKKSETYNKVIKLLEQCLKS